MVGYIVSWYLSLPSAEAVVPCGNGSHAIRWEAGQLTLPGHPDAEAELVLGALGGDKPACVTVAQTWSRHAGDLAVLTAGPRCLADRVTITRAQIEEQRTHWPMVAGHPMMRAAGTGAPGSVTVTRGATPVARAISVAGLSAGRPSAAMIAGRMGGEDFVKRAQQRLEVLELLALGPAFQFRLSGAVAADWASAAHAGDRDKHRPTLTAALTGRVAPAAAEWLGLDPDDVTVTPHPGPGWGSLAITGTGTGTGGTAGAAGAAGPRQLRASLPLSWLSDVWACGLAVVDGHLVVGVEEPGYPRARVLALRAPGTDPVTRAVEAADQVEKPDPLAGALPRWSMTRKEI